MRFWRNFMASATRLKLGTKKVSRVLTTLMTGVLAASVLAACSPHSSSVDDANPVNTGTLESEGEQAAASEHLVSGQKVFVTSETLRLRSTPEITATNIAGSVSMNAQLELLDSSRIGDQEFVAVRVVSSSDPALSGKTLYTSVKYLSASPSQRLSPSTGAQEASGQDHFVIVNVATEMIRLYKHCHAPEACKNKMLMEFHGTVGNNSNGMRSDVGVYKTTKWTKFYEVAGEYPGYYRPGYPELPKPGSRGGWTSKNARPPGFSSFRGAFGWYTVFVGPNNDGQWMHGTIGWGADKSSFVRFQDSFLGGLAGIFAKLGSHGCTRLSNEAIAYMRSNLPVGAYIMKVYAKESLADSSLTGYPAKGDLGHFPYIITKVGYGQNNSQHELAARDVVLADGTPQSQWLEQGTFDYDRTPTPASGNHYKLKNLQGVFNVDDGTLSADYRHPIDSKLKVAGYPGRESAIPSFARSSVNETAEQSRMLVQSKSDSNSDSGSDQ
jgi:hypothetical protein